MCGNRPKPPKPRHAHVTTVEPSTAKSTRRASNLGVSTLEPRRRSRTLLLPPPRLGGGANELPKPGSLRWCELWRNSEQLLLLLLSLLFLLSQLEPLLEEVPRRRVVVSLNLQLNITKGRTHKREPHAAVTPLRPGNLRQRCRQRPLMQGRRCPSAVVRLVPCLLSWPSHHRPRDRVLWWRTVASSMATVVRT